MSRKQSSSSLRSTGGKSPREANETIGWVGGDVIFIIVFLAFIDNIVIVIVATIAINVMISPG